MDALGPVCSVESDCELDVTVVEEFDILDMKRAVFSSGIDLRP